MRLPNQYGSVYKLSGNRRKPWAARKTVGWKEVHDKKKVYPVYQFIGYYATRKEALQALALYNKDPYALDDCTLREVYEKWSAVHYEKIAYNTRRGYEYGFRLCESIAEMKIKDIKLAHLQTLVDSLGKSKAILRQAKIMLGLVFDYAIKNELLSSDRRNIVSYVDIDKDYEKRKKPPFSKEDVEVLWKNRDSIPLMLIYTGVRIMELLDLNSEDVHLERRYFSVKQSKTESGIRDVPICEKIVPFFEKWLANGTKKLITINGRPAPYSTYLTMWNKSVAGFESHYTPHCTRHTFISRMVETGVDNRVIQEIVGHKGADVTQSVYTHIGMETKLEAVNLL